MKDMKRDRRRPGQLPRKQAEELALGNIEVGFDELGEWNDRRERIP